MIPNDVLALTASDVRRAHRSWRWEHIVVGWGGHTSREFAYNYDRKGLHVTRFGTQSCDLRFTWRQVRAACGEPEDGQQTLF